MLTKLSAKYQKEIALSLINIFVIGGLASFKMQAGTGLQPGKQEKLITINFPGKSSSTGNLLLSIPQYPALTHLKPVKVPALKEILFSESELTEMPLIGGPGQPEMSSFKPVGSDNMVSPFTGDFSYNIPLLDVGGYPVNMFYNSGITMDQEASWVGLGWNINPGAVNRNMRGLPDDFNGEDTITKRQSIRPDKTWGFSGGLGIKFIGLPLFGTSLDINTGLSFNNKLGVAAEVGIHPALSLSSKGSDTKTSGLSYGASVGSALNLNSRSGASNTPSISFSTTKHDGDYGTKASIGAGYTYSSRLGLEGMHLNAGLSMSKRNAYETTNNKTHEVTSHDVSSNIGTLNSGISFVYPTVLPSVQNIFTRRNYSLSFGVGLEITALNPHGRISGYYTESSIAEEDQVTHHPAYGFLHYQEANKDPKAMLDFNRLNDGVYTPNSPAIALPVYTYDIFSITGEGTGGSFRAYRGEVGYMRDAFVQTKDEAFRISLDVGSGNLVHGGAEFTQALSPTTVKEWKINNPAAGVLKFKNNDSTYQAVYFKNPGEKAIPDVDFQNAIGGENLVRFKMSNVESGTPMLLPALVQYDGNKNEIGDKILTSSNTTKSQRDKRTQVITFLTAEEAADVGFNKRIYSYNPDSPHIFSADCNKAGIDSFKRTNFLNSGSSSNPDGSRVDDYRKPHHISEINVLGTDGRKYVYGLPVYNTRQVDVSFSIENGNTETGKSIFEKDVDDAIGRDENRNPLNTKGRDWYVQQEETPAYTHSFLLTELVSPNYVDITGNGVTEDDMGDAVKFNYSRFDKGIKWRTPSDATANYSEGLKTDPKDDKAHYIYGEREMWLLYSIESKNMIARFYVKNDRKDGKQVSGPGGGIDENWGMQRLDKICLYSKGDLANHPERAKPIKTIRFFQSYKLCKGAENSISGGGKLTLDSIWITYNGNDKKPKSRFIFSYPADNNPTYNFVGNDRWGTYKPPSENPGSLTNADYPYSVQDKAKADKYAAAWTMNKITLPSGGVINVHYESDDYAYVQNKKAASMQQIIGFGNSINPDLNGSAIHHLYEEVKLENNKKTYIDNEYIYIRLPYPVTGQNNAEKLRELAARYFENTVQLYMKLAVTMPSGKNIPGGTGQEIIPVYADIASFGLIDSALGLSSTVAWVQVKRVANGMTPMAQQALQFLKQQLPGKAYKGYDVKESSGIRSVVMALAGMTASYKALRIGEDMVLKEEGKCKNVVLARSFARLTNPLLQKKGGGLRVKQVIINDNWNKMAGQYESTYGQEYKYSTKELINNKLCTISSGVAAWEPSIGNEENPHNEIMRFQNHNKGGPFDFGAIMMPLGEAFYPAPMVGYSRVEVLSIHRDTVKNLPTRQVTEFYTTKDFPFKSSYTSLIDPRSKSKLEPRPILQLLNLNLLKGITLSQGFLVDMNDMNGKEKIQATYSAFDSITPVSYTQNFYNVEKATDNTYGFNHNLPAIASAQGKVGSSIIGRDIELMADFREHNSEILTTNISPNFDFFFLGIFPIPLTQLLQPTIQERMTYRSASLLKIVNHYGVLDSVVVIDKGSMVSTKNLVYDAETGNPLLTRTNNEHNRPVYNFTYPAHWAYSGMGQAYKNIDATYKNVNFSHGKLMSLGGKDMDNFLNTVLESGDEFYALSKIDGPINSDGKCDDKAGTDAWTTLAKSSAKKIWAVNTGKASENNPQWIFIDKDGNPFNSKEATIRLMRSGRRNLLDQNVGSVTSLDYPVNNNGKLKFNEATLIIQTGAATFKDHWRVDNSFYVVDSVVEVRVPVTVRKLEFTPDEILTELVYKRHDMKSMNASVINGQNYFMAEQSATRYKYKFSRHYLTSFVKYNLSSIPADATILVAKLSLVPHYEFKQAKNKVLQHTFPETLSNFNGVSNGNKPGIDDANHLNKAPLQNNYSFSKRRQGKNTFKFTRFTKDWPAINSSSRVWLDYIRNQTNRGIEGPALYQETERGGSYIIPTDECFASADVSSIVKKMVTDRSVPSIIGMELDENRNYLFADGYPEYAHPSTKVCFYPPTLSVYYYTCGDNNSFASRTSVSSNVSTPSCEPNFPQFECVTSQHRLFCFSKFTEKKSINPYTEGILGNWRIDTTFAYYGDRKESDPTLEVDTRTGGTIANYKDFWNLSNSAKGYLSRNINDKGVWVWNSTITQYNRKGYEIENKDPLGRFNAGLYGYNQQLPVAVANNARVREALFDGFEDYDYKSSQNCATCKPHRSFNYDRNIQDYLDATQHHTGLKSLRLKPRENLSVIAPVTDIFTADRDFGLRMRVDSMKYKDTAVQGKGTGLKGYYVNYKKSCGKKNHGCIAQRLNTGPFDLIKEVSQIDFQCTENNQCFNAPGIANDYFAVRWKGYFQANATGLHSFQTFSDDGVRLQFNGSLIINDWNNHPGKYNTSAPQWLIKGKTYSIQLDYFDGKSANKILLQYKKPGQEYEHIPTDQLYLPDRLSEAASAVTITNSQWCTRLDSVNVRGNALTDSFSVLQNKKMLVSAWVKEGGNDCKCSTYTRNNILVSYKGSSGKETLKPKGSIIEGWQRYEEFFDIPASAREIKLTLANMSDVDTVYFDDLRIHPFNANMKSFVYHSSNLRLTSELDENNYATFYEYDDDGTLTRVKKETERGIKTITETRSAMQKVIREE